MERLAALIALCFLSATLVGAHSSGNPFLVKGKAYCDTCNCGFETTATKYLAGARVQIQCRDIKTNALTYTIDGVTNSEGEYNIVVNGDRGDDLCDVVLMKSPDRRCSIPNKGRDRARVILTRNNGMVSDIRYANNMGFTSKEPLASCAQILAPYHLNDDNF
ncbi:major pollen allergen Lol p 11-like [Ipomoea triloba]|uniref:major pollen allergen Lol p 11-like n=1 Tax=Ipomoea triloba TaxID=35885 RepID=UPI00125D5EB9|nr:major pollen allergen Lol p 11-like [Ipomoea triloba]